MINEKEARRYCSDDISLIQNYQQAIEDQTQVWHCHHRLQFQGEFHNSAKLLKKCGMYKNVPAWQLIFLKPEIHDSMHGKWNFYNIAKGFCGRKGIPLSKEHRQKLSQSLMGHEVSDESREKNRIGHLGRQLSPEHKAKFTKAGQEASRKRLKGCHWWNNGEIAKQSKECPGEGWKRGRTIWHGAR